MNEVLLVNGKAVCDPLSERYSDIFLGMRHKRDIGKCAVIVCFMGKHWIQIREPYHGGEGMAETGTKRKGGDRVKWEGHLGRDAIIIFPKERFRARK